MEGVRAARDSLYPLLDVEKPAPSTKTAKKVAPQVEDPNKGFGDYASLVNTMGY